MLRLLLSECISEDPLTFVQAKASSSSRDRKLSLAMLSAQRAHSSLRSNMKPSGTAQDQQMEMVMGRGPALYGSCRSTGRGIVESKDHR